MNEEFLEIGQHCSLSTCGQLDYLPLSCVSCRLPFCGMHFRELAHECSSYDPKRGTVSPLIIRVSLREGEGVLMLFLEFITDLSGL